MTNEPEDIDVGVNGEYGMVGSVVDTCGVVRPLQLAPILPLLLNPPFRKLLLADVLFEVELEFDDEPPSP